MATITVTVTNSGGVTTREVGKRSFVIGSGAGCDVVVAGDPQVSEQHVRAIARRWDGAMILRPLAGTTTWVNRAPISSPVTVGSRDDVRIGVTTLTFARSDATELAGAKRWWDPRDWGTGGIRSAPQPISHNPPAPHPPVPEPEPRAEPEPPPALPDPMPTWNPPPPNPLVPMPIVPMPLRNPPPPNFQPLASLPAPRWRARLSDDATEHDLLAALRDAPADPGARMVYADWLERAGREVCAGAVRGDDAAAPIPRLVPITDADWRGIASCADIHACTEAKCPRRWSALAPVHRDERSRGCEVCGARVFYASSVGELEVLGAHDVTYAIDAGMADIDHAALYRLGRGRRG